MPEVLTQAEWTSVLAMADLFDFATIQARAIKELDKLLEESPIDRPLLADRYSLDNWEASALTKLVCRGEGISLLGAH